MSEYNQANVEVNSEAEVNNAIHNEFAKLGLTSDKENTNVTDVSIEEIDSTVRMKLVGSHEGMNQVVDTVAEVNDKIETDDEIIGLMVMHHKDRIIPHLELGNTSQEDGAVVIQTVLDANGKTVLQLEEEAENTKGDLVSGSDPIIVTKVATKQHVKQQPIKPKPIPPKQSQAGKVFTHKQATMNPVINPAIASLLRPHLDIVKSIPKAFDHSDITMESDGVCYININDKGKTILGKFFDASTLKNNFIFGEMGKFSSFSGLSFYLTTGCSNEKWRELGGNECYKFKKELDDAGQFNKAPIANYKVIMAEAMWVAAQGQKHIFKALVDNELPFYMYKRVKVITGKVISYEYELSGESNYLVKAVTLISAAAKEMHETGKQVIIDWSKYRQFDGYAKLYTNKK